LEENSGSQRSIIKASNEKNVQSDLQRRIQPGFDIRLDYNREDTKMHYLHYYIETYDQYNKYPPTKSTYNYEFTAPEDWTQFLVHSLGYYKWPGSPGFEQMISAAGMECYIKLFGEYYIDGTGVAPHGYQAEFI
jgi:hypothetical protein